METITDLERFKQLYALNGVEATEILMAVPMSDTPSELIERDCEDSRCVFVFLFFI